jgi:hypothetical protein
VEPVTWDIHIVDALRSIKGRQLKPKPPSMLGLNPRPGAGFKEPTESFMLERLDHSPSIARCASRNKVPNGSAFSGMRRPAAESLNAFDSRDSATPYIGTA